MPVAGFKPVIPAIERLQTYAIDSTDTVIGGMKSHRALKLYN
jgi:hypothetical protein